MHEFRCGVATLTQRSRRPGWQLAWRSFGASGRRRRWADAASATLEPPLSFPPPLPLRLYFRFACFVSSPPRTSASTTTTTTTTTPTPTPTRIRDMVSRLSSLVSYERHQSDSKVTKCVCCLISGWRQSGQGLRQGQGEGRFEVGASGSTGTCGVGDVIGIGIEIG